jgi:DNA topoisomerase I
MPIAKKLLAIVQASSQLEPTDFARLAGLNYVSDEMPGIRRRRAGKGWIFIDATGKSLKPEAARRLRALVIPPAWQNVWICPTPHGHIQAVGRDARGRKQYIYHPDWDSLRGQAKFSRMILLAKELPEIRRQVDADLRRRDLSRRKVAALIVRMLEHTLVRIGNDEYAQENGSYGLTTLRKRHLEVSSSGLTLSFRGKSGVRHSVGLQDRRLARQVKLLQELPGQELFQYQAEDGTLQTVDSGDVNEYLRSISGEPLTAKDFRTWGGTVLAATSLYAGGPVETAAERKNRYQAVVKQVAHRLGNTPTICRKYYIHPAVPAAFDDGSLFPAMAKAAGQSDPEDPFALSDEELAVLSLLESDLKERATGDKKS